MLTSTSTQRLSSNSWTVPIIRRSRSQKSFHTLRSPNQWALRNQRSERRPQRKRNSHKRHSLKVLSTNKSQRFMIQHSRRTKEVDLNACDKRILHLHIALVLREANFNKFGVINEKISARCSGRQGKLQQVWPLTEKILTIKSFGWDLHVFGYLGYGD
jgi:hypothetical protein